MQPQASYPPLSYCQQCADDSSELKILHCERFIDKYCEDVICNGSSPPGLVEPEMLQSN